VEAHVTNGIGVMLNYAGQVQPSVYNPEPVHPQTYQRYQDLKREALQSVGLSESFVNATRPPPGITAAVALEQLRDENTERHVMFGRSYESGTLQAARLYIDAAKRIAESDGDAAVSVPMRGGILSLNWKDVSVDKYELRVFSSSVLPQQPMQRMQKLQDLFNAGLVDRSTFFRQLEANDLQAELDLETSDRMAIDEMLEFMLEADDPEAANSYLPPSRYQSLEWGVKRAQQKVNMGIIDGVPEGNLDLLRQWIGDAQAEMDKLNPPAPQLPMSPVGNAPAAFAPPVAPPTEMPPPDMAGMPLGAAA
jgi:hypothetical protein